MTPIRVGQWVKTADGTIGVVRQCTSRTLVSVELPSGEVELPRAELRRVANPYRRPTAIVGLPAERGHCARCTKAFRALTADTYAMIDGPLGPRHGTILRRFIRWQCYRELFCTLTCALAFAELAHKAGYRITRTS